MYKWLIVSVFCFLSLGDLFGDGRKPPSVLYLTWMNDPSTTMTVQWHTLGDDASTAVLYRKNGDGDWLEKEGLSLPLSKSDWYVHTVELDALEPDGEYEFEILGRRGNYRFRTLPETLSREVKFVVGGDAFFYLDVMCQMNRSIAKCDPDFVVVGGDIAYTVGRPKFMKQEGWELQRWRTFLKEWRASMVTSDGRLIPLLPVLGNHDIKPSQVTPQFYQLLFYELFALPEPGIPYRVFDAGDYLSLFLLDTGHTFHIGGQQARWLEQALSAREDRPFKLAAYHIGAYPSVYSYEGKAPKEIREQWSPLFERYHVDVAFEHHNHSYKRTHPLKGGQMHPGGVVYMGDGSWGVNPRKPKARWYLEKSAQANAVCLVTLEPDGGFVTAVGISGKEIDRTSLFPRSFSIVWNESRLLESRP